MNGGANQSSTLLTSHVISRVSVYVDSLRTPVGFMLGAGNQGKGSEKCVNQEGRNKERGHKEAKTEGTRR